MVPEKWKKYALLATFGLSSEEELISSIVRFPWKARYNVVPRISALLSTDSSDSLFVVKLVPLNVGQQLPNYRVRQEGDLADLEQFIDAQPNHRYVEVWYCQTNVDATVFSVAGRIRVAEGNHVLEQVWRCSPRMIEEWGKAFRWPYARAMRPSWGWRWRVDEAYLPEGSALTEAEHHRELQYSLRLLEGPRERLREFAYAIESCGITTYSLEYKIVGRRVTIIDWDTPDDRKVLNALAR